MTHARQCYLDLPSYTDPLTQLTVPAHRVAYTEWGDEKNEDVVLCVHGLTRNGRDFDYLASALSDTHRVLCLDVPGRGKSDYFENAALYHNVAYQHGIISFLELLEIKQLDWIGTSMGGLIGMLFAYQTPTMIKKMVVNDVGPYIAWESLERIAGYVSIFPEFVNKASAERYLRDILAPFGIKEDEAWSHMVEHGVHQKESGKLTLAYDPHIAKAFKAIGESEKADIDLWPLWSELKHDLLVLRGEKSDILTKETFKQMADSGSHVSVQEFQGVGHAPALMSADQIEPVIQWIRRDC